MVTVVPTIPTIVIMMCMAITPLIMVMVIIQPTTQGIIMVGGTDLIIIQ